ncbi:MAG: hypothetical protein QOJ65_788 [Fimbriimonadaceae bacterium]|jgi:uncharacterized protein YecE (DUF72 family)|nr:hypothetical protein [Fimbriimonadaceae bacterium]
MVGKAYMGTSGWVYPAWKLSWYEGRPARTWLGYIDEKLGAVEVDGTFYRQQKKETFEKWASQVSPDFKFAIRGHRYITHRKKLLDVADSVQRVKEPALGLGNKLGAVLWQLPPFMKKNADRLRTFAEQLQTWPGVWHVMEFRNTSWFDKEIAGILEEFNLVNCISDAGSFERWDAVTADAVYVRLHGKPNTYWDWYTEDELADWGKKVTNWTREGREVYVYFDNDAQGAAPWNALKLNEIVGGVGSRVSLL